MSNLLVFLALWQGTIFLKKSDLDIIVDFSEPIGMFKFLELRDYLCNALNINVDLTTPRALKSAIRLNVEKDVIYV